MPGADALKACFLEGPHRPLWSVLRDSREAGFRIWGLRVKGVSNSPPPRASGFFFTGPLGHFFYLLMERWIPSDVPLAGIKRLLLDRLLFAPAFLSLFFLVMNFLEVGL